MFGVEHMDVSFRLLKPDEDETIGIKDDEDYTIFFVPVPDVKDAASITTTSWEEGEEDEEEGCRKRARDMSEEVVPGPVMKPSQETGLPSAAPPIGVYSSSTTTIPPPLLPLLPVEGQAILEEKGRQL